MTKWEGVRAQSLMRTCMVLVSIAKWVTPPADAHPTRWMVVRAHVAYRVLLFGEIFRGRLNALVFGDEQT